MVSSHPQAFSLPPLKDRADRTMEEHFQQIFDDTYDEAYAYYQSRMNGEEGFTAETLRGLLASLYVRQGNDWEGRGQPRDITLNAMIAAAETVLSQWDGKPRMPSAELSVEEHEEKRKLTEPPVSSPGGFKEADWPV